VGNSWKEKLSANHFEHVRNYLSERYDQDKLFGQGAIDPCPLWVKLTQASFRSHHEQNVSSFRHENAVISCFIVRVDHLLHF
jgi:hypothetical protein